MKIKHPSSRTLILVIIAIAILLAAFIGWKLYKQDAASNTPASSQINSFDECVAAGNAIMTSYPEQCMADGKTFTKQY